MTSTKAKILETAESLFATQGIATTSLRSITQLAGVNLAAVNYHFGNKKNLVHEVFRLRLDELNQQRIEKIDQLMAASSPPSLEQLLEALIIPAFLLREESEGGARFIKVIARAYAENDSCLHRFLSDHYGHVFRRFAKEIKGLLPEISEVELRLQLNFVIGALTYVMADFGHHFFPASQEHSLDIGKRLVAFAAAGMRQAAGQAQQTESIHYNNMKYAIRG